MFWPAEVGICHSECMKILLPERVVASLRFPTPDPPPLDLLWNPLLFFRPVWSSVCSVLGGIRLLRKACMHSTLSLKSYPNIAFETVPVFVSLMMALSRPFKERKIV